MATACAYRVALATLLLASACHGPGAQAAPENRPLVAEGVLDAVAFTTDGKQILTGGRKGVLFAFDAASGELVTRATVAAGDTIDFIAPSPDGSAIAIGGHKRAIHLVNPGTLKPAATLKGHRKSVRDAAWSADAARIASASSDGTVRVWDVAKRRTIATLKPGAKEDLQGVALSPSGQHAAAIGMDGRVYVWNVGDKQLIGQFDSHKRYTFGLAFRSDTQLVAPGTTRGTVVVWDVDKRAVTRTVGDGAVKALGAHQPTILMPDKRRVAQVLKRTVRVWDVTTGERVSEGSFDGGANLPYGMAADPAGRLLATCDGKGTVSFFDPTTGRPL